MKLNEFLTKYKIKLKPEIKTDIGFKNLFGMGGGENFQMEFKGEEEGVIIIQPCEGIYQQ